jgi:hypothetical protein
MIARSADEPDDGIDLAPLRRGDPGATGRDTFYHLAVPA